MGELKIQIDISETKLRAWVSQKIGIKNAAFPDIAAAQAALDEFVKENSLYGSAAWSVHPTGTAGTMAVIISGKSDEFKKLCRLIETEFSVS